MIALSLTLFITSGLAGVIYSTALGPQGKPAAPPENILLIAGLIMAVVVLLIAGSIRREEG